MNNTVIIAENSPAIAKSIAESFSTEGYHILGMFTDGISALRCAKENPSAILTLDLILPRLSGLQLTSALQKLSSPPLIIAISAVTARPRLKQAKESGVRYYILKPLAGEKLRTILREHSTGTAVRQAAV